MRNCKTVKIIIRDAGHVSHKMSAARVQILPASRT